MRRCFVLALVAAVVAGAGVVRAQEPTAESLLERVRPLPLGQALEVAVRQNPALTRASIDITIAEAAAIEAQGLDDWVLTGDAQVTTSRSEPVEGRQFQITATDSVEVGAGLTRVFAFGGSLGLRVDGSINNQTTRFAVNLAEPDEEPMIVFDESDSTDYFGRVSVEYVQPLLRGFGEEIARAARRRAVFEKSGALLREEVAALDAVRTIVQGYWELAYLSDEIGIRRSSLDLAQEQLRITRAGIDAGSVAPTEALAVEQAIAVREEAILLAEVSLAEQSLALRRLVGMEIGPGEILLSASDELAVPERTYDIDAALARAFEASPQLALLEVEGDRAALEVSLALDALKPRLDLAFSGGPTGNDDNPGGAAKQLSTFENYAVSARVEYQQSLGRSAARGQTERARALQERVKIDVEEVRRDLAASVVQAVNLVRTARKRIEVTQKSIELAEQNLAAEKLRFEAGHATNFDVLQRQNELEQARLANARAVTDYLSAVATVESLTGELLPRYGITISEDGGGSQ